LGLIYFSVIFVSSLLKKPAPETGLFCMFEDYKSLHQFWCNVDTDVANEKLKEILVSYEPEFITLSGAQEYSYGGRCHIMIFELNTVI
jgi:hypothetical protein